MKKRKQHYVWRNYLDAWTTNGQLFCLRGGNVFLTNPINVAQQRDFYRLNELTENDIAFIRAMLIDRADPFMQFMYTNILEHFNFIFKLKKCMKRLEELILK